MNAIESLINRAELLFERGQLKMCNMTLDEIENRLQNESVDKTLFERFEALCLQVPEPEVEETNPDRCTACHGSGQYKNTANKCFACKGKGVQSSVDIARNRNYWSRRQRMAALATRVADWL